MGGNDLYLRTGHDPALLKVSERVEYDNIGMYTLINEMKRIMKEKGGVGIAAPQLGQNVRVIIACNNVMINPVIIQRSGRIRSNEMCLSYPGYVCQVKRSKNITVTFTDTGGKARRRRFKFGEAIIVQHEIDHLNGITLPRRGTKL